MGNLLTAAQSGNYLQTLVALRDRLAQQIDETDSGRDTAALSRQFVEVVELIDQAAVPVEKSKADEIAAKRTQRRAVGQ